MDKRGSVTIATIIIFAVFLPLLLYSSIFGIRYANQLNRCLNITQHAADTVETSVLTYDPSTNTATFESNSEIEKNVKSIINGNLNITETDLTQSFVREYPTVEIYKHETIGIEGETFNYEGKDVHLEKPGVVVVIKYKFDYMIHEDILAPTVTVVRKYEIQ
jgi:hypothetical protein